MRTGCDMVDAAPFRPPAVLTFRVVTLSFEMSDDRVPYLLALSQIFSLLDRQVFFSIRIPTVNALHYTVLAFIYPLSMLYIIL